MKPRALAVLALAVLLLAVPTAAQAKGATAATIDGGGPGGLPGGPITLRGGGEPGSRTDLGMLAQGTGLYATVFDTDPGAVLKAAPTDRLGPRYTITWRFPDPAGGKDRKLRQRVWPYAAGGPVSFPGRSGGPGHDQQRRLVPGLRRPARAADRARPAQPQAAGPGGHRHPGPGRASTRQPATRAGHRPVGRLAQGRRRGRRLAGPRRRGRSRPAPPPWPRPRHRPLRSVPGSPPPTGAHPYPKDLPIWAWVVCSFSAGGPDDNGWVLATRTQARGAPRLFRIWRPGPWPPAPTPRQGPCHRPGSSPRAARPFARRGRR